MMRNVAKRQSKAAEVLMLIRTNDLAGDHAALIDIEVAAIRAENILDEYACNDSARQPRMCHD